MKLSERMRYIVDMCIHQNIWADIGCDHGLVSAALILEGRADRVIATDISAASLNKTKVLLNKLDIDIECRVGDGLKVLKAGEAQGAVISGMGAPLIISILEASKTVAAGFDRMVLSANNYPERLREYLTKNGYDIYSEQIALDMGRYYPIMAVMRQKTPAYTEDELEIGRNIKRDLRLFEYIKNRLRIYDDIINEIKSGGGDFSKVQESRLKLEQILKKEISYANNVETI